VGPSTVRGEGYVFDAEVGEECGNSFPEDEGARGEGTDVEPPKPGLSG
jgi:hypothetical protein